MTLPSDHSKIRLPVLCGPTGVGKTALAIQLADRYGFEIVSADSRQVYREMDIGTAKPTPAEQQQVRHHLIDVVRPDQRFDASQYRVLAAEAVDNIIKRGCRPILVGGTGLYIRALLEGLLKAPGADPDLRQRLHRRAETEGRGALHRQLATVDPAAAKRLHPNDLVRIVRALEVFFMTGQPITEFQRQHGFGERPFRTLKIGLQRDRDLLFNLIDQRAQGMFELGLVEETQRLLSAGYPPDLKALRTIGYRQAVDFLYGRATREEALADLQRTTRRYAKQQLTWFRQDKSIIWVDSSTDFVTIRKLIDDFYVN